MCIRDSYKYSNFYNTNKEYYLWFEDFPTPAFLRFSSVDMTLWHKISPVSYTHLDVYKRQAEAIAAATIIEKTVDEDVTVMFEYPFTVSYTHLDVYKRQR